MNLRFTSSLLFAVLLCLFFSPEVHAQNSADECPIGSPFFGGNAAPGDRCHGSVTAACTAIADALSPTAVPSCGAISYQGQVGLEERWFVEAQLDGVFHSSQVVGFYVVLGCDVGETLNTATGECEAAPMCDGSITGDKIWRPGNSLGGGAICMESSQCVANVVNINSVGSSDLVEYVGTNQTCGAEPPTESETTNQEQCISEGGNTWCTDGAADENCGMYNGSYVCLDTVPDGGCTFFGNGDMACASNATSPPAPDNGTPGQTAPPDSTIGTQAGGNSTTTNIFNSNTVDGSAGGTSGNNQGDPAESPMLELDFSEIIENEPSSDSYRSDIDTDAGQLGTLLDGVETELGDPNDFGGSTTLGTTINDAFQYSACSDIILDAFGNPVTLSCADVSQTRDVLGWIARVIFLIAMFQLLTRGPD